jgi:ribosomal protein S18 acetylase RimI-like enzyme
VGVVVGKLEPHRGVGPLRGYIAMLATKESYRGRGIATKLVQMAIEAMKAQDADEVPPSPPFFAGSLMLVGTRSSRAR